MYNVTFNLKNKKVDCRKWRVKDKNKFVLATNTGNSKDVRDALVYDCMKTPTTLSNEEYKFVFMQLRDASIKQRISYQFDCEYCNNEFITDVNLSDVITKQYNQNNVVKSSTYEFVMGDICNRQFYDEHMVGSDDEKFIVDFILHIKTCNNDTTKTFDQILDIINELEVDEFEEIVKGWNDIRFQTNIISDIECPKCKKSTTFEFDELPGFFPDSWGIKYVKDTI